MAVPRPKVIKEVCSLCGIDWHLHGKNPTAEKCVELLLDEVKSLNAQVAHKPLVWPYPYVNPWRPLPYTGPYWATWTSTNTRPLGSNNYSLPQALTVGTAR